MQQSSMLRDELEVLKRELGTQARVAHALGRSEEWTSRTLKALARGEQPRLELKTELAIHNLYAFVVFASKRLGPNVRVWLFVPREEFDHSEPAAVLREGRIHEVIEVLLRDDGSDADRPGPRRSSVFRDVPGQRRPRRFHLDGPRRPALSLEELDRHFAGKRLDLEGVIYGTL